MADREIKGRVLVITAPLSGIGKGCLLGLARRRSMTCGDVLGNNALPASLRSSAPVR